MILNGRVINPGELRTQVVLEQRTVTSQAGGFGAPSWTAIATVWSRWTNAHGQEGLLSAIQGAEALSTVLVRYRSELDQSCAVKKGGVRYEIVSIDDIAEKHEYMELRVKRMEAG